jgi:hypothetical protein
MKKTVLIVGTALLLAAAALIPLPVLEIRAAKSGECVFVRLIRPGDLFSLTFIHSVEKSPVRDDFKIDERYRIVLYETAFRTLNTGMPTETSGGERWIRANGEFRVVNRNRVLPEIRLPVDGPWANTLGFEGGSVFLPDLSGDGLLVIRIGSVTPVRYGYERIKERLRGA